MARFILSAFADEIDPDLKIQMDVLEQHGIKYIELRGVYGKSIVQYTLEGIKDLKKKIFERGFGISAIGSPIGKIGIQDDFAPHLELFRHTIEIAKIMETNYIRMFSFYIPEEEEPGKFRDEVISRWNKFVDEAEGTGITLLHENEKGIYGDTPERCLDLFETLDCDYVKAVYDPANFIQCDVETYPHAFDMLKEYIEYMHIKDALYKDHSVVPAGYGDGRVYDILAALYQNDFEGFLSLEPHLGNFVGFSQLEQGIVDADLPEGGPKQFSAAANALKKIISRIER